MRWQIGTFILPDPPAGRFGLSIYYAMRGLAKKPSCDLDIISKRENLRGKAIRCATWTCNVRFWSETDLAARHHSPGRSPCPSTEPREDAAIIGDTTPASPSLAFSTSSNARPLEPLTPLSTIEPDESFYEQCNAFRSTSNRQRGQCPPQHRPAHRGRQGPLLSECPQTRTHRRPA